MSLGMEVLQPLNGKRLAAHRDSLEEGGMLIKRFRGEPHAQNVTPMAQQQHPNINSSVANTPQKHVEANNGATSSSSMLSAEEMNAWIVHGGYSPRVVQSYCRPDVGAIYRGDCY